MDFACVGMARFLEGVGYDGATIVYRPVSSPPILLAFASLAACIRQGPGMIPGQKNATRAPAAGVRGCDKSNPKRNGPKSGFALTTGPAVRTMSGFDGSSARREGEFGDSGAA